MCCCRCRCCCCCFYCYICHHKHFFCVWLHLMPFAAFAAYIRILFSSLPPPPPFISAPPMKFLCLFTLTRFHVMATWNNHECAARHTREISLVPETFQPNHFFYLTANLVCRLVNDLQIPCIKWDQKTELKRLGSTRKYKCTYICMYVH